jgi:hypothetical protein
MKLLYVYDKGANCQFWEAMLPRCEQLSPHFHYHVLRGLPAYLDFDQSGFEALVYQTFPDEEHRFKFDRKMVAQTDAKFLSFPGIKILLDSRDVTDDNGLPRFGNWFPRIKHLSGPKYNAEYQVILSVLPEVFEVLPKSSAPRDVVVHCAFNPNGYPHQIRPDIYAVLHKHFEDVTNFTRIDKWVYRKFLQSVQIAITAPGYGYTSTTAFHALNAEACLFVHEMVGRIDLLPYQQMIDGKDYVLFNLDNMEQKLRALLDDPVRARLIAKSGRAKFLAGIEMDPYCHKFLQGLLGVSIEQRHSRDHIGR